MFFAENSWEKIGSSTFLLGADQRLSGEGVFNGIYYCPLGLRAPCTCIPLCMRLVILMFWLRASTLSIVNSWPNFRSRFPSVKRPFDTSRQALRIVYFDFNGRAAISRGKNLWHIFSWKKLTPRFNFRLSVSF